MNNNRITRGVIVALEHHHLELKEIWFSGLKCVFKTTDNREHWFLYSQSRATELDIANAIDSVLLSQIKDSAEES